jgi:hypothetical protein
MDAGRPRKRGSVTTLVHRLGSVRSRALAYRDGILGEGRTKSLDPSYHSTKAEYSAAHVAVSDSEPESCPALLTPPAFGGLGDAQQLKRPSLG